MTTGSYRQWDVWLANVKYEDSPQIDKRPVLILFSDKIVVYALKMTRTPRDEDYPLQEWKSAGLNYPTTVRIKQRLHLLDRDFIHKLGRLHPADIIDIQMFMKESLQAR